MLLKDMTPDLFKKVLDTYVATAYPEGISQKAIGYNAVTAIYSAKTLDEIFKVFEKVEIPNIWGDADEGCGVFDIECRYKYVARLGSKNFQFLKLVLQQCEGTEEYGFLVDRHAEYLGTNPDSNSFTAETAVKDYTKEIKLEIENKLEEQELPTYRALIRELVKVKMKRKESMQISPKHIHMLLVEDDKEIRDLHKIELEMLGYTVTTASSGEQGLRLAKNEYFDVMLLDLMMPKMSGFEVIRQVGNEIIIIVLTALGDNMTRKQCLEGGAKEMVTKPADFRELSKLIDSSV